MWIGPRTSVLIRSGAIFSPCMKKVKHINDAIEKMTKLESETGCCIRLDNSGCVQTPQMSCSRRTSVWIKYKNNSGPLCGQDPKYCSGSEKWPAKITEWPICRKGNNTVPVARSDNHIKCKVQGNFITLLLFIWLTVIFVQQPNRVALEFTPSVNWFRKSTVLSWRVHSTRRQGCVRKWAA